MKVRDSATGQWIKCRQLRWDRESQQFQEISEDAFALKDGAECAWVGFGYKELLALARQTRKPLLAVLAELHRLHFRAWDKKAQIELSNSACRKLGFDHHTKMRALKALEAAGWITVQWRRRKAPSIKLIRGFYHGR